MLTYKEIQNYIKENHNITVKSCWIAHVKELNGLPVRQAQNRIAPDERKNPCSEKYRSLIEDAFRNFRRRK